MPKINILNILSGDNQSTVVDKINYNFDQILSAGGGPQGQQGVIGATGPVGPQGVPGIQGAKGDQGNKWFVQAAPGPAGSSVGDFWLDVNSPDQAIYENIGGSWSFSGFGLSSGDIFQRMNPVKAAGGQAINRTAIILGGVGGTQTGPQSTTLVLSDAPISGLGGYSPGSGGESYIRNVNQEDSKLKIATEGRLSLISFSRSDLDIQNPSGNGINNPTISWASPSSAGNGYDIAFKNPTGGISILTEGTVRGPIVMKSLSDFINITSLGTASGGVNILATNEITSKSTTNDISIFTAASTKGTFIRFNPTHGFAEINTNVASAANSSTPSFFANATGVGIGVGKLAGSTFKQNGDDPRKLAVLGNVSISRSGVDHETTNMFIGINAENDYNKGSLFVRGHGAFGHNDPRTDETSGLTTIGPSETGKSFPRLFVTASRHGQVFQVKNAIINGSQASVSRTTMGNGIWDQSAVADKTSAGAGPDLTQEFFTSGYTFTANPLISFQHKITDSTNVTDTATVFSISTFTIGGTYNSGTIADKTLIQTKNSNSNLRLFANATSTVNKGNNRVIIGARNRSLVAVFAGTDTDTEMGTVTIGANAENNRSTLTGIFDVSRITIASIMTSNHSLSLPGTLTIGDKNPYSAWGISSAYVTYGINSGRDVGNVSMAKITRVFGPIVGTGNISGGRYNNTPNGLEIVSYKDNTSPGTGPLVNKSVAIAVGASGKYNTEPAPGFFVSDDGKNASIGSLINYSVALNVEGAINATTSVTTPLINASTINCPNITGGGSVPVGTIVMWFGGGIPTGWSICDGNNGTPNLIDKFVIGGYANNTGGSQSPTTGLTVGVGNLPGHTHGIAAYTTASSGAHSHNIGYNNSNKWTGGDGGSARELGSGTGTFSYDGGGAHTHTIPAHNTDNGTGGGSALAIYKYYQLRYIMRIS
jgi:hypothetical protein